MSKQTITLAQIEKTIKQQNLTIDKEDYHKR